MFASAAVAKEPQSEPSKKGPGNAIAADKPARTAATDKPAGNSIEKPSEGAASPDAAGRAGSPSNKNGTRELLREGTKLVDEVGYFRLTGDRAVFYFGADGKQQLNALENLALERVARVVGETPDQLQWSISGTVTEYRGNNYLSITKALIKRKGRSTATSAAR